MMKISRTNYLSKLYKILQNDHSHYFQTRISVKYFSTVKSKSVIASPFATNVHKFAEFDYDYLCSEFNRLEIKRNILSRKNVGDIDKLQSIWMNIQDTQSLEAKKILYKQLNYEANLIPNKSSNHLLAYGSKPKILKLVNEIPTFKFKPYKFMQIVEKLQLLRGPGDKCLSVFTGPHSYYLNDCLAQLERALIRYTVSKLLSNGFTLLSVPDILYNSVIEQCGMPTKGKYSHVYHISNTKLPLCLSGTSEMAIGGMLQDKFYKLESLPLKFAAISRCYRKEKAESAEEKGMYRVHAFTKIEMFGVTANETGEESNQLYNEFVKMQEDIYSPLGFHFQVLDMPLVDLGAPAYVKTDIEAWIPVEKRFGEISSASNCLDFQSRRLKIKYRNKNGLIKYAHTVNGTACAIPRVLITMITSNQCDKGIINIPEVLQPFMKNKKVIIKNKNKLSLNTFKGKSFEGTIIKNDD